MKKTCYKIITKLTSNLTAKDIDMSIPEYKLPFYTLSLILKAELSPVERRDNITRLGLHMYNDFGRPTMFLKQLYKKYKKKSKKNDKHNKG